MTPAGIESAEGCEIAFPACQASIGGVVLLYTVNAFATTQVTNAWLAIERHTTPSNPSFQCPLLVLCDAPVSHSSSVGESEDELVKPNGSTMPTK